MDICPRCGSPGSMSVEKRGGRRYIYFIHMVEGRRVKHYVGPTEGYIYVEKLHEIALDNIKDVDYFEVVERALSKYIDSYLKKHADHQELAKKDLIGHLQRVVGFCNNKIVELSK